MKLKRCQVCCFIDYHHVVLVNKNDKGDMEYRYICPVCSAETKVKGVKNHG